MSSRPRSRKAGSNTDEAALAATLTAFLSAEKTLSAPIHWTDNDGDLRFSATLDVDGVTVENLILFGRATASVPDAKPTPWASLYR